GVRRLVVAVARSEQLIEFRNAGQRRPFGLSVRDRMRAASATVPVPVAVGDDGKECLTTERGSIRRLELSDADLAHPLEALRHDLHVRIDNAFAKPAELFDVLAVHHFAELLLADLEFLEQRRDREEGAEKRVSLHAQLE